MKATKVLRLTFELEETQPGKYKVDLKTWIPRPKRRKRDEGNMRNAGSEGFSGIFWDFLRTLLYST